MQSLRIFTITFIIVLLDQITKLLTKKLMFYGQSISIIGDFVRLTYIENPGMAFGIRFGGRWLLAIVSIIVSIGIVIYIFKIGKEKFWLRFSLAFVLGGAIGNLIDRVLYGRVVDFVDVGINLELRWPVFNVADSAVSIGMIILIALMLFEKEEPKQEAVKQQ